MIRHHPGGRSGALRATLSATLGSAIVLGLGVLTITGPAAAQNAYPETSLPPAAIAPASVVPASMAPPSMAPPSMAPAGSTIAVGLADFMITPAVIDAVGPTVVFEVTNAGPTPHNFTIRDAAGAVLGATQNLSRGDAQPLTITNLAPGTYITFCSLPGHESLGVKGELVVTEAGPGGSPGVSPMASPIASPAA